MFVRVAQKTPRCPVRGICRSPAGKQTVERIVAITSQRAQRKTWRSPPLSEPQEKREMRKLVAEVIAETSQEAAVQ